MKLWRVDDVMTRDPVAVREDTPCRDVVAILVTHRVSAVPVVDVCDHMVGVVSEADLLPKVEATEQPRQRRLFAWRHRHDRVKVAGRTAGDVMTSPVVSVMPSLSVAVAARRMHEAGVKRLPVEDELGRLVGIVTGSDLLKIHLRSDGEIRHDVADEIMRHVLDDRPGTVEARVSNGVVTLAGRLRYRSAAERAVRITGQIPGVADVINELDYDVDDISVSGALAGMPYGIA